MTKDYHDLSTRKLLEYYNTLTLENATHGHIQEVEKELESRNNYIK